MRTTPPVKMSFDVVSARLSARVFSIVAPGTELGGVLHRKTDPP